MLTLTITIAETEHEGMRVLELRSKGEHENLSEKEDIMGRLILAHMKRTGDDLAGSQPIISGGRPENG